MKALIMILSLMGLVGCAKDDGVDTFSNYELCKKYAASTFDMGGIKVHDLGQGILIDLASLEQRPNPFLKEITSTIIYEGCEIIKEGSFEYMNTYDIKKTCKFDVVNGNVIVKEGCSL